MQNKLDLKQRQNKPEELTELQQKQIVQQQSKLKTNLENYQKKGMKTLFAIILRDGFCKFIELFV